MMNSDLDISTVPSAAEEEGVETSVRVPAEKVSKLISNIEPIISTAFITHFALGDRDGGGYYVIPLEEWVMFGDEEEKIFSRTVPLDNLLFTLRNITSGLEDSMNSLKEISKGSARLPSNQKSRMEDWLKKSIENLGGALAVLSEVDSHQLDESDE